MASESIEGAAEKALVIGGGIAGITSALDLANQGHEVYLIERRTSIGGRMAQLDKTFPTLDCSICILAPKMVEVARHPRIHLLTFSEVKKVEAKEEGKYYEVTVVQNPRYVDAEKCTGCGICVQNCPSKTVPDEFDEGMGERKAINIPFPQAVPRVANIDAKLCLKLKDGKCGVCAKKCPVQCIKYDDKPKETVIAVRSIIVATGYDTMEPKLLDRFGRGDFKNVISSMQYERLLTASGPTGGVVRRPSDGKEPKRIGMVLCAGSRNTKVKEYCSKICCVYSTKNALLTIEHAPGSQVTIFYNDLRVAGKGHEEFLNRAAQQPLISYVPSLPGNVEEEPDGSLTVSYVDARTDKVIYTTFDLLVLYTPIIPSKNSG
ncbi:MAG: FAD-dependent oxidoreductase [Methanomassiliicoccales archaeon]|nr:FAD-dependent oxidoreductase [Methanomassiliicoccales archaeon]